MSEHELSPEQPKKWTDKLRNLLGRKGVHENAEFERNAEQTNEGSFVFEWRLGKGLPRQFYAVDLVRETNESHNMQDFLPQGFDEAKVVAPINRSVALRDRADVLTIDALGNNRQRYIYVPSSYERPDDEACFTFDFDVAESDESHVLRAKPHNSTLSSEKMISGHNVLVRDARIFNIRSINEDEYIAARHEEDESTTARRNEWTERLQIVLDGVDRIKTYTQKLELDSHV